MPMTEIVCSYRFLRILCFSALPDRGEFGKSGLTGLALGECECGWCGHGIAARHVR